MSTRGSTRESTRESTRPRSRSRRRRTRREKPASVVVVPASKGSGPVPPPTPVFALAPVEKQYTVWPPAGMVYYVDENPPHGKLARRPPSPPNRRHVSPRVRTVRIENLSDASVSAHVALPPNTPLHFGQYGGAHSQNSAQRLPYCQPQQQQAPYQTQGYQQTGYNDSRYNTNAGRYC
ncbi:hypothetical protein DIPPA_04910 [Diplonema papillatum]|nr:hypothetical protein DIPPA_04910 [Diplonema papillatum]